MSNLLVSSNSEPQLCRILKIYNKTNSFNTPFLICERIFITTIFKTLFSYHDLTVNWSNIYDPENGALGYANYLWIKQN